MQTALQRQPMATLLRWMAASLRKFWAKAQLMLRSSRAKATSRLLHPWNRVMRRPPQTIPINTTHRTFLITPLSHLRRCLIMISRLLPNRTTSGRPATGVGVMVATTGFLGSGVRRLTMALCGHLLTGVTMAVAMGFTMDTGAFISAFMAVLIMASVTSEPAILAATGTVTTSTTTAPLRTLTSVVATFTAARWFTTT